MYSCASTKEKIFSCNIHTFNASSIQFSFNLP